MPQSDIRFEKIDLASLVSIESFAERVAKTCSRIDLLINNAGVMVPPRRLSTEDGFELQLGTNYLGHFALTAISCRCCVRPSAPRFSVSSVAARAGAIDFEDLNAVRNYNPMAVYSQSKLACLMFALELQRRSEEGRWGVMSLAAHPALLARIFCTMDLAGGACTG